MEVWTSMTISSFWTRSTRPNWRLCPGQVEVRVGFGSCSYIIFGLDSGLTRPDRSFFFFFLGGWFCSQSHPPKIDFWNYIFLFSIINKKSIPFINFPLIFFFHLKLDLISSFKILSSFIFSIFYFQFKFEINLKRKSLDINDPTY